MTDVRDSRRWFLAAGVAVLISCVPGLPVVAEEGGGAPSRPAGNRALCQRCHDDLAAVIDGSVVHAPVSSDTCTSCHNPHAARHGNLLREDSRNLCFSCHADSAEELQSPVVHGALRSEPACLVCHDAHASNHAALLRGDEFSVCGDCHAAIRKKIAQEVPHAPAAVGECSGCHEPHAGDEAGLLDEPVPALCFACHEAGPALSLSHEGFEMGAADCLSCHDAHGTRSAKLVRDAVHAVFEAGSCDMCHASTDDPRQFETEQPELCTTCHDQYAEPSENSHPRDEEVLCTGCHSPHAGEPPAMLRGAERSLCLDCHGEIRSAIDRGTSFHPLEADDGRCTACHGLHDAADRPLLARSSGKLCESCHTDHSRFAHPMGLNVSDPTRPGRSLDCLSCHNPHASRYKSLLLASPDRDLCVRCHQALH